MKKRKKESEAPTQTIENRLLLRCMHSHAALRACTWVGAVHRTPLDVGRSRRSFYICGYTAAVVLTTRCTHTFIGRSGKLTPKFVLQLQHNGFLCAGTIYHRRNYSQEDSETFPAPMWYRRRATCKGLHQRPSTCCNIRLPPEEWPTQKIPYPQPQENLRFRTRFGVSD